MEREDFAARLAKSRSEFVRAFATRAREGMCWGNLADAFEDADPCVDDRLALWSLLLEVGLREPLLLFVDLHREQPDVLARIAKDAARLPATIQCALASLEVALPVDAHPAARELAEAPASVRARECSMYEAHAGALRGLRIPEGALIVHGVDVDGPDVVTFRDTRVKRFVGGRRVAPSEVILHETVTRSWSATVRVLEQRKLGVHLIVDADGTTYQHGDLADDVLWHASQHNAASVGIEVVNPYYPRHLRAGDPWTTTIDAPWAHEGRYVVPTPAQAETTASLVRWLSAPEGLAIPRVWRGLQGKRMALGRVASAARTAPGIYAHAYFAHADGLWLALYAWLRLEAGLEPSRAYDTATTRSTKARGSVNLSDLFIQPAA